MTNRLTKFEKSPNSKFPYKLKDDSLCTELDSIHKLGIIEDLMEKYNVNEKDIEIALIIKKITQNGFVYYEDDREEGTYFLGPELDFDFETNEIVLSTEFDDDYFSRWEEIARLPILDYKKKYWLKEDKSE